MAKRVAQGCAEPGKGLGIKGPENNSTSWLGSSPLYRIRYTHTGTHNLRYIHKDVLQFFLYLFMICYELFLCIISTCAKTKQSKAIGELATTVTFAPIYFHLLHSHLTFYWLGQGDFGHRKPEVSSSSSYWNESRRRTRLRSNPCKCLKRNHLTVRHCVTSFDENGDQSLKSLFSLKQMR